MGRLKKAFYYPKKLKQEATPFWEEQAGREYSRGHKYQKMPGAFNKYMAFHHKSNALAYYGAAAASKLGPNNLATLVLDIASMGRGSLLTKAVGKGVGFLRGTRVVARSSTIKRGIDSVAKAAKAWSNPSSKLFKARKAVKLGTVAARSLHGNKSRVSDVPIHQRKVTPRTPFSQHPWSQIPVPAKRKPVKKVRSRQQRGPSYSFLDQVKVADWTLQSMHKPSKRKVHRYDPFMSTTDRLRRIEKRAEARVAEERRIRTLLNRFERSISKPQSFNAHKQMRQKYGAKIDAIAKRTPKFTPGSAYMSPQDWRSLQKKGGISQSFKSPMSRPIASGAGRSLRQNRLRSMAGPLVNPNRARPMMKPMFR
jgi:hypothetical protein